MGSTPIASTSLRLSGPSGSANFAWHSQSSAVAKAMADKSLFPAHPKPVEGRLAGQLSNQAHLKKIHKT